MMRLLSLAILLGVSSSAQAYWKQVCYYTTGCYKIEPDEETLATKSIIAADDTFIGSDAGAEYAQIGINFKVLPWDQYSLLAQDAPTEIRDVEQDRRDLEDIDDTMWDTIYSGGGCAGSVVGCAAGLLGALETGGLSLRFARVSCALSAFSCVATVHSYK